MFNLRLMMHKIPEILMRELHFRIADYNRTKYGIFISQDKYMAYILKKFDFTTVKAASTPIETNKALNKDEGTSRPDIMFAVCACARFQVTPKVSHLHAVKRIFRYLKGQPKLGLWYPRDSPFDLEAFSDSDYDGASLDRKSTTGGCQFLGKRFNFMNTKIHIDNESTICIVKNPAFHSKTKHIEIRHHIIRDSYEKKLIQVIKIHTDHNVADLLKKAFDVSRYALIESLTIYVSLIEQFWQTASASTLKNGDVEITATIDGKVKVVSEASIRRHLKLEDSDGISTLPTSKFFEQLALMGTLGGGMSMIFKEFDFEFITPEEDYTAPDISTANVPVSTASAEVSTASPEVKTVAESLVYIRRSATKRKYKGKAIMKEAEPVQKKTKLQLKQERLGLEKALRLQEQLDEEERKRIARVHEEASTFNAENSDDTVTKVVVGSSKRDDEQELNQESSKRQKIGKGSEPAEESKEYISQEQVQQLMIIVPKEGMNVEALQTKYPIIAWEVYTEDTRKY
ncbi:hypothetical protein Tco_0828386 [Tanacetum coccineum]